MGEGSQRVARHYRAINIRLQSLTILLLNTRITMGASNRGPKSHQFVLFTFHAPSQHPMHLLGRLTYPWQRTLQNYNATFDVGCPWQMAMAVGDTVNGYLLNKEATQRWYRISGHLNHT